MKIYDSNPFYNFLLVNLSVTDLEKYGANLLFSLIYAGVFGSFISFLVYIALFLIISVFINFTIRAILFKIFLLNCTAMFNKVEIPNLLRYRQFLAVTSSYKNE